MLMACSIRHVSIVRVSGESRFWVRFSVIGLEIRLGSHVEVLRSVPYVTSAISCCSLF